MSWVSDDQFRHILGKCSGYLLISGDVPCFSCMWIDLVFLPSVGQIAEYMTRGGLPSAVCGLSSYNQTMFLRVEEVKAREPALFNNAHGVTKVLDHSWLSLCTCVSQRRSLFVPFTLSDCAINFPTANAVM